MTATRRGSHKGQDAIHAGLLYLAAQRREGGYWVDYHIFGGDADTYVTAYVACMLAELRHARAPEMAADALEWLRALPRGRRWGFSPDTARDADSTLWVLRLAERLGCTDELLDDGYEFVEGHVFPDGAVSAHRAEDYRERFGHEPHLTGWYARHMCVTAGAGGVKRLPSRPRILQCLRREQQDDGSWTAYWWLDREYSTAFAGEALAGTGVATDAAHVNRAVEWMSRRLRDGRIAPPQHPDGSPWLTALALRLFALAGQTERQAHDVIHALLDLQRPDGSWTASAFLRAPYSHERVPDDARWIKEPSAPNAFNSLYPDMNRTMTTATVVNALALATAEG